MSKEITLGFNLQVARTDGQSKGNYQVSGLQMDQTNAGIMTGQKQTIPTTGGGTAITFTGLTQARWVAIRNTDATNYVDIGPDNSGIQTMIRLLPGESCVFPMTPAITLKGLAHTASVVIEKFAVDA